MQGALPPGWVWTTLGAVANTTSGGTPSRKQDEYYGGDIPWIKSGELRDGLINEAEEFITQAGLDSSNAKLIPAGTTLVALYGATVGRTGILNIDAATNQAICAVFPINRSFDAKYMRYWLQYQRPVLVAKSSGGAQPNISQGIVRAHPFPLAPHNEQRRIVAKIEELLTRLDAGVAALKRAQANLKRYKASVLKAACEGKLVPTEAELARAEGRTYEPADELLKHILAERCSKWEADLRAKGKDPSKVKYIEPQPPDTSGLPELPEGWCWASADQLISSIRSGSNAVPQDIPTTYPILRSSSVRSGQIDYADIRYVQAQDSTNRANFLQKDNLLFTRLSGSIDYVGNCALVKFARAANIQYPDRIFCATLADSSLGMFMETWFMTPSVRKKMTASAKSTAGHQRISMGAVTEQAIPIPPFAEQRRIDASTERRLSVISEVEVAIATNIVRAERLRQSILRRAFSGKLVPQDPSDEPASALLERIKPDRIPQSKL